MEHEEHRAVPYLPRSPAQALGVGGVGRLGLHTEADGTVAWAELLSAEAQSLGVGAPSSRTPHGQGLGLGLGHLLLTQQVAGWDPRCGVKGVED